MRRGCDEDAARVIAETIERERLREIEVMWVDHQGHARGKRIGASSFLDRAQGEGFAFCSAALTWDITGEVQSGLRHSDWETGFPDFYAVPDLTSFRLLPWREGAAHVISDLVDEERRLVAAAPRSVLRRAIGRLAALATGARVADRIIGFVTDPDTGERLLVEIDPGRPEVEVLDDWDVIGERLSASNGLVISGYELSADEVIGSLGRDGAPRDPHRTLGILSFQLVFVHLLLGTAEGALLAAREYTRTTTRPWIHASVVAATEDPHILATYGRLVSRVQALAALAHRGRAGCSVGA